MPKTVKPLTALQVERSKANSKPQALFDGGGLFIIVTPKKGKWWRFKYTYNGKSKMISLGVYPDISLEEARERRHKARNMLANGIDPGEHRKEQKAAAAEAQEIGQNTLERVARQWFDVAKVNWTDGHAVTVESRMERDILPQLGKKLITEITAQDVLAALRLVEDRQAYESAHRIKTIIGQIYTFAIVSGIASHNPAAGLSKALKQPYKKSMSAILDPDKFAGLLRDIDGYSGSFVVRCALKLAPMLFVRPGELRNAKWQNIYLDEGVWQLPVEDIKLTVQEKARRKGEVHTVYLSQQAVVILRELYKLTGEGMYVFPGRAASRVISENTVNQALRAMGYDSETVSGHGFRATARTMLHETLNFTPDAIEAQLGHTVPDRLGTAYNRTKHLAERKTMMQQWADYLDGLKAGAKVIPFKSAKG
jgi:integrase